MSIIIKANNCMQARKKIRDIGGTRTHNLHISGGDALPVKLPSLREQGGGECGTFAYNCLFLVLISDTSRLSFM